jgi:hypothetical protein
MVAYVCCRKSVWRTSFMEPVIELKKTEKILDVYNDVFYSPAKLQDQIVCILA